MTMATQYTLKSKKSKTKGEKSTISYEKTSSSGNPFVLGDVFLLLWLFHTRTQIHTVWLKLSVLSSLCLCCVTHAHNVRRIESS